LLGSEVNFCSMVLVVCVRTDGDETNLYRNKMEIQNSKLFLKLLNFNSENRREGRFTEIKLRYMALVR